MAVSVAVTLPGQPVVGASSYTPLGGDGLRAPFAAQNLNNFQATGDASGGGALLTVNLDPRFVSLVAFVPIQIIQGTSADVDARFVITAAPLRTSQQVENRVIVATSAVMNTVTIAHTWNPTPQLVSGIDNPRLAVQFLNVNGDEYFLDALIYLFRLDVREKAPMGPLLWARGAT